MIRKIGICFLAAFILLSCSLFSPEMLTNTMGTAAAMLTQTPGDQSAAVSTLLSGITTQAAGTVQPQVSTVISSTMAAVSTPVTNVDGTITLTDPVSATFTQVLAPSSGDLTQEDPTNLPNDCAGVTLSDFMMQVTFTNPAGVTVDKWDYAVLFRDQGEDNQLRLVLYDSSWYINQGVSDEFNSGDTAMNLDDGGSNTILLIVMDKSAYLAVNGQPQAQIDVSSFMGAGDVCVAAWVYQGDPQYIPIHYADFSVWAVKQ